MGRLEEIVARELDFMWVNTEEVLACTVFCNSVSHLFAMLFPMLCGGEGEHSNLVGFCFSFNNPMCEEEENLQRVGVYLETMRRLAGMLDVGCKMVQGFVVKFLLRDVVLYRCAKMGIPPSRVRGMAKNKKEVQRQLDDKSGNKQRDGTCEKAPLRYYWDGLYRHIDCYICSYEECQKHRPHRYDNPLHPMFLATVFAKVGLDVVLMPTALDGSKYIVGIPDDLSRWAEYKVLRKAGSQAVRSVSTRCGWHVLGAPANS